MSCRNHLRVGCPGTENVLVEGGKQADDGMRAECGEAVEICGQQISGAALDVDRCDPLAEIGEPPTQRRARSRTAQEPLVECFWGRRAESAEISLDHPASRILRIR